METTVIPTCPNCQAELQQKKGPYGIFYGCPNYRECKFKGQPVTGEIKFKPEPYNSPAVDPHQVLLERVEKGFKELNERLDNLGKFIANK